MFKIIKYDQNKLRKELRSVYWNLMINCTFRTDIGRIFELDSSLDLILYNQTFETVFGTETYKIIEDMKKNGETIENMEKAVLKSITIKIINGFEYIYRHNDPPFDLRKWSALKAFFEVSDKIQLL
jgi:hypothetical protein